MGVSRFVLVTTAAVAAAASACSGSGDQRGLTAGACADAATASLVPRRDAGPECVAPEGGACPSPGPDAGSAPDPANWGCYVDSDCAVFSYAPFCDDDHRCYGPQRAVTCVAGAWDIGAGGPEIAHSYQGSNGSFTNRCDSSGNLVGYRCEAKLPPCSPGQNGCDGPLVLTGRVVPLPSIVDCVGQCRGARCDGRCPQQGDQVTVMGEDASGSVLVHDDSDGRTYACAPDPTDQHGTNFDCVHAPVGKTGLVTGRSVEDGHCTGAAFGGFAVVLDGVPTPAGLNTCGYGTCSIRPSSGCFSF